jgi:hypothetical protein
MRCLNAARRIVTALIAAVVASALSLVAAPSAHAGDMYYIKTATVPSGCPGCPEPGGHARLTNKPYGYYIGRALVNSRFTSMGTVQSHRWGRAHDTVNMCGWTYIDALAGKIGYDNNSCSAATQDYLSHRLTIGRDFNYPAHVGNQPTAVAVHNPHCGFYLNYFYGTDYTSNGGRWNHHVGPIGTYIEYRFTTRDGGAYVMRHPSYGWGFVQAGCTARPGSLHNDND